VLVVMAKAERVMQEYVPAAMRPFTHQIAPGCCRVRFSTDGRQYVGVHGRIVAILHEGKESCYLRGPSGGGKLYARVEDVDAAVARLVQW